MEAAVVSPSGGGQGVFFESVQNPFVDYGQIIDRASSAATGLNISWNNSYGEFLIQSATRCVAQNPPPFPGGADFERCVTDGNIFFTANSDLLLTVDAAYDYNLAGPNMSTRMIFQIFPESNDPVDPIFTADRHDDTYTGYPASGTFGINGQAIVPASSNRYILTYEQSLWAEGNTGAIADGSGYIHFTLQAIPEPATLAALLIGTALARKRNRRLV